MKLLPFLRLLPILLLPACADSASPNANTPPTLPTELTYTPLNDPEHLGRSEFSLFLPPSVTAGQPVRGVIALSFNVPFYDNPQWRDLADREHLVLLKYRTDSPPLTPSNPPPPAASTNPAPPPAITGDALRAITRSLQQYFAPHSRHLELPDAPFLFVGQAESSLQVCTFADMIPDHVIGAISLHTPFNPQMDRLAAGPGTRVPQLLSVPPANAAPAFQYFTRARKFSGTVTLLLESSPATTDAFALRWAESVIDLRLPVKIIPGRGVAMHPIPDDLFAGNLSTHTATPLGQYTADRAQAVWLPDQPTANLWSQSMTP